MVTHNPARSDLIDLGATSDQGTVPEGDGLDRLGWAVDRLATCVTALTAAVELLTYKSPDFTIQEPGGDSCHPRSASDLTSQSEEQVPAERSGADAPQASIKDAEEHVLPRPPDPNQFSNKKKTRVHKYPEEFAEFWKEFPRKCNKQDAYRAWCDTEKDRPPQGELLKAVVAYCRARMGEDPRYTKGPAGWLRDARWTDEPDREISKPIQTAKSNKYEQVYAEAAKHGSDPHWKSYKEGVLSGRIEPGFERYVTSK